MKSLGDKVNLIPLIAKADTLTADELKHFKQMVNQQIAANDIKVFEIPDFTPEQQQNFPEMNKENKKLKVGIFAADGICVGSLAESFYEQAGNGIGLRSI